MANDVEKIKLNKFGIRRTVSVKITVGQIDRLQDFTMTMLELELKRDELLEQPDDVKSNLDFLINEKNIQKAQREFLQNNFKITDEELQDILESISKKQFEEAFGYVTDRMRGVTDEQYNLAVKMEERRAKEEAENPKEEETESEDLTD
ncbi:phage tail tube assembly chaperone [Leuconostoc carnosum]|uniref:phage tail tube assembly chaperone n=1 Tax=Leuconostoc carnosum TaxID=1252 RepID=UPI00123BD696|nr:phage tail tube assembly chaperone [Leuconostoc carnosum]KAA8327783.1 molecular chaperone [Leuconostoc carnosum]KAA8365020.1 molecular chaperone [Leuconostoc carnosum]